MENRSLFLYAALPITLALLVGCTDGGAVAFRHLQANGTDSLLSESLMSQGTKVRLAESNEHAETLVATASERLPRQPSLVTLAAGEDLMAKINNAGGPVLLDFYADWCGPCQAQVKILHDMERTAAQRGTLMIKINIDDHPEIAGQLRVQSIPTLMMVKDGRVIHRQTGVADAQKLTEWMQ